MRILWLFLCVLLLVGCSSRLEGTWKEEEGLTEVTFNDGRVQFMTVEGSYEVKGKDLIMKFEQRDLIFEYDLDGDQLTLFINDSKITLQRQ